MQLKKDCQEYLNTINQGAVINLMQCKKQGEHIDFIIEKHN